MLVQEQDVDKIIREINNCNEIALDFETRSLHDKTMVAFSFAYDDKVYFAPVQMTYFLNLTERGWTKLLITIASHPNLIFHHSAFDLQVLRNIGIVLHKAPHDTLLLAHLYNENGSHKLKDLVKEYFNYTMLKYKDVCGTGKKQIQFSDVQDKKVAERYASDDAKWTLKLYHFLHNKIYSDEDLKHAYTEVERPLLLVVDDMHSVGVPVNREKIDKIRTECESKIDFYYSKLQYYMDGININSSKQLKEYFIEKKGMPKLKFSRITGQPSVDAEVLEKYAKKGSKEADWILKYRYYTKILTTFEKYLV